MNRDATHSTSIGEKPASSGARSPLEEAARADVHAPRPDTLHSSARLPDFRNLGVLLRILLAVNAASLVAAVLKSASLRAIGEVLIEISALVQPVMFLTLLVLALFQPTIDRNRYEVGVGAVLLTAMAITAMFDLLGQGWMGGTGDSLPRHLFFTVVGVGMLLSWFDLRSRALSPALVEARLQALQARIRPHFLFNSLNAVLSLIRADPRRAEHVLEDLADLFRALMADSRALSTFASEVELARQYLAIEQVRLGDRLRVEWDVDQMPGEARLPALVLQPLLENAVYHGIEPSIAPGTVTVRIFRVGNEVHAILSNPLPASGDRRHGNRIAVDNIRERLQLFFDAEARMRTRQLDGRYEVTIRVPYTNTDRRA
ncbi:MAG: histidine kinase [Proteobacteria bacterium]|nr:histidine kinase [Burkholderiales bacterium]